MNKNKKSVVVIALITAICVMGDAMLYIVLPIYWKDFGLSSIWQVGILLSINRIIRLPINPIVGFIYHKIPKNIGLYFACSLTFITTLSYGFASDFWLLLVMRGLWGVAWSILRLGGYLTVIDASTSQNRGELIGTYNGLWGLGSLVGMLTGGIMINYLTIQALASIFAGLIIVSLLLIYVMVPNSKSSKKVTVKQDDLQETVHKELNRTILVNKQFIKTMVMGLLVSLCIFGVFASYISKLLENHFQHAISFSHVVLSVTTLAGIIQAMRWGWDPFLAPLIGRLSDKKYHKNHILAVASFLSSCLFLVLNMNMPIILVISLLLSLQLLSTFNVTMMDTIASEVANSIGEVKVMTIYTMIIDVGAAIGPLIVFLTIDLLGIWPLHIIVAFIYAMIFLLAINRDKKMIQSNNKSVPL